MFVLYPVVSDLKFWFLLYLGKVLISYCCW